MIQVWKPQQIEKSCSCTAKNKPNCPLNEKCLTMNIVYEDHVIAANNSKKFYLGISATTFLGAT